MNQLKNSSQIIALIIVLALGYLTGNYLPFGNLSNSTTGSQTNRQIQIKDTLLSNKVIKSASLAIDGKVTEIAGGKLTVTDGSSSFIVPVSEGTKITHLTLPNPPSSNSAKPTTANVNAPSEIKLTDIKTGDHVSAMIILNPNGSLNAVSVTVISQL